MLFDNISYGEIEKEGNYQSGMIYIYRLNDDVPLSYLNMLIISLRYLEVKI